MEDLYLTNKFYTFQLTLKLVLSVSKSEKGKVLNRKPQVVFSTRVCLLHAWKRTAATPSSESRSLSHLWCFPGSRVVDHAGDGLLC